ncbi:troponin I, cardiac muscle-like isoform X1 [Carassius carassius]|uniref:troponin I, cardiac muscle-like isoform X1 n=1 Tax=Carassius carassius TaxID=217509 RepID=UPI0028689E75|nr:troponin I, cardiac muscle-like isoform X1 [Carassius carassius]
MQELCRDLHHKIDIVDEARYDLNIKVARNDAEILSLTQKIYELKGKMKRPNLKRVKKSADAMLGSLSDTRVDFKANLKTVKKEEEKVTLRLNAITRVFETPGAHLAVFSSFAQMCCV